MTIGYEGKTLDDFLNILEFHNIDTLVDVRELPLSRKAGFSKKALRQALANRNITYVHLPALGCPRSIRQDYRNDHDWERYTRRFMKYLSGRDTDIQELAERTQHERCCLLCFEADAQFCHRSYVAEQVAAFLEQNLEVQHLTNLTPVADVIAFADR